MKNNNTATISISEYDELRKIKKAFYDKSETITYWKFSDNLWSNGMWVVGVDDIRFLEKSDIEETILSENKKLAQKLEDLLEDKRKKELGVNKKSTQPSIPPKDKGFDLKFNDGLVIGIVIGLITAGILTMIFL